MISVDINFSKHIALSASVYRMHDPVWAFSPISGEGARLTGGRFNPRGKSALYTSMDALTAIEEASDGNMTPGLTSPMLLVSYNVTFTKVLDLTDFSDEFNIPWRLQSTLFERRKSDQPITWQIYKEALKTKTEAIMVKSYQRDEGINLVILDWDQHRVEVHDPQAKLLAVYGDRLNFTK